MAKEGHNGAGERVTQFVERVERLEAEKTALSEDITQVLQEAKGAGFDPKIIKTIVKIRKDQTQFETDMSLVDSYMREMGCQLKFDFSMGSGPIDELTAE
jgi:uncharacterized protein (UPF0335 family)